MGGWDMQCIKQEKEQKPTATTTTMQSVKTTECCLFLAKNKTVLLLSGPNGNSVMITRDQVMMMPGQQKNTNQTLNLKQIALYAILFDEPE